MEHRRYFIRKDPETAGRTKEWIEMDGEEFYRFLQTKEEATQTPPFEVEPEKEAAKMVHRT